VACFSRISVRRSLISSSGATRFSFTGAAAGSRTRP
jgi:hypothetical protein